MDASLDALADAVLKNFALAQRRTIVAMAGPPGSGKSTSVEALNDLLNAGSRGIASILPMDGYHYDDGLLKELGRLERKGAPDTFDVGGYASTLRRLRSNDEAQVTVPVFDRALEISRGSARMIPREVGIILTEGNYLLLSHEPWSLLRPLFDLTVKIETPIDILRNRLDARWREFGLPENEVRRKVDSNDLPNARFVIDNSGPADFVIRT
ncbi:MAG: nucleoside triphosphate hydrolase [Rhizobiales bacterium]|nr:nucleoside triphosphate hydrolase [Hyphomicrobiales bacterium]